MSRQNRVRCGIGGDGIIDADGKLNGDTVDVEAVSVERCLCAAFTAPLGDDSADQATAVRRLAHVTQGVRQLQAFGVLVTGRLCQMLAPGRGGLAEWAESLLATVSDACAGLFSVDDAEFIQADEWRRVCASALGAAAVAAGWLLEGAAGRRDGSDAYPCALHDVVCLLHDALLNVPAAVGVTHTAPGVDRMGGSDDDDENEPDRDRDENGKVTLASADADHSPSRDAPPHQQAPIMSTTEVTHIQDDICRACEALWHSGHPERHRCVPQMLLFLVLRSLGVFDTVRRCELHRSGLDAADVPLPQHKGSASERSRSLRRLNALREALFCVQIFDDDCEDTTRMTARDTDTAFVRAHSLASLLRQASCTPAILRNGHGRKWLAFCLSGVADARLPLWLHAGIVQQALPAGASRAAAQQYGEVYFRAWRVARAAAEAATADDTLAASPALLEEQLLRDLVHKAIFTARPSLATRCRQLLSVFHAQKRVTGVDDMLARLYEPVLFRAMLRCAHATVRAQAVELFVDAFPIVRETDAVATEGAVAAESLDAQLSRQFDVLSSVLADPAPRVRVVAVRGVCRILAVYWELLPASLAHRLLSHLAHDLAYDAASARVRQAVCEGVRQVVESQPLAHPMLAHGVLRALRGCLHDKREAVRWAMADLLLSVSRVRDLQWHQVVSPAEDVLPRLAADDTMQGRLVALLAPSYFVERSVGANAGEADGDDADEEKAAENLARCLGFVESHAEAARLFYTGLCEGVVGIGRPPRSRPPSWPLPSLQSVVRFVVMLAEALLELTADAGVDEAEGVNAARRHFPSLLAVLSSMYATLVAADVDIIGQLGAERVFELAAVASALLEPPALAAAMPDLWRMLACLPRAQVADDVVDECLDVLADAASAGDEPSAWLPLVTAAVRWGRAAEVLGERVLYRLLAGALDDRKPTMERSACMARAQQLLEHLFARPETRRVVLADAVAHKSVRSLFTMLLALLDDAEPSLPIAAMECYGRLALWTHERFDGDEAPGATPRLVGIPPPLSEVVRWCARTTTSRQLPAALRAAVVACVVEAVDRGALDEEQRVVSASAGEDTASASVDEEVVALAADIAPCLAAVRLAWSVLPSAASDAAGRLLRACLAAAVQQTVRARPEDADESDTVRGVETALAEHCLMQVLAAAGAAHAAVAAQVMLPLLLADAQRTAGAMAAASPAAVMVPCVAPSDLGASGRLLDRLMQASADGRLGRSADDAVQRILECLTDAALASVVRPSTDALEMPDAAAPLQVLCALTAHRAVTRHHLEHVERAVPIVPGWRPLLGVLRMRAVDR